MDIGLEFKAIYGDVDIIEVRVSAWNGSFGGVTELYAGTGQLAEVAGHLRGFPRNVSDILESLAFRAPA